MAEHDNSYKNLFSHKELVRDLLTGFIHEEWIEEVDLATLEKVSSSFVSDDLRDREDDVIWRVRCKGSWIYVYLLIEFQSSPDRFMAVRLMTYIGLLYQDLIKSKQIPKTGMLPPVLPLVLYNGDRPWNSPLSAQELIQRVPGGLERYSPALSYLLLDETRYPLDDEGTAHNLVAAVFRLEQCRSLDDIQRVTRELLQWMKEPEQARLRRSFAVWIRRVLTQSLPETEMPETNDLTEVNNMLSHNLSNWAREQRQQALQQGLQQGMQQGMQQGKTTLLLQQMASKFGTISETDRQRVRTASDAEIAEWSERILTADSLQEMFRRIH